MRFALLLIGSILWAEDVVIVGARIADGTGAPLRVGNVRFRHDTIVQVGAFAPRKSDQVINGQGMVLAPGFIDPHNHSDRGLAQEPAAVSQVSQGITTVLLGQDGGSALPLEPWFAGHRKAPSALNVASLAGHATIRRRVMGDDLKRVAKPEEVTAMAVLLEQAMKDGALGLSSGLEYEVGSYADTAEMITLAKTEASVKSASSRKCET